MLTIIWAFGESNFYFLLVKDHALMWITADWLGVVAAEG